MNDCNRTVNARFTHRLLQLLSPNLVKKDLNEHNNLLQFFIFYLVNFLRGQKIAPWKIDLQQIPAGLGLVLRLGQRAIFRGNCRCTNVLKVIKFIT